ncbi:DUF4129 domain-containing protein [Thermococcus guaymasensis]
MKMSIRVKSLLLLVLLFLLMTLLMGYSVKTEELKRTSASSIGSSIGILLSAATIVSVLALLFIFLSWRDISSKRESKLSSSISWIAIFIGLLGYYFVFFVMGQKKTPLPSNSSFNATTNHASVSGPALPKYNVTSTNATSTVFSSPVYILYATIIVFVVVVAYFAVAYYRDALKKRKLREMRRRAELFDRKVGELGLDMFSDPREAVVGIYKNAVLWLEVLGVPYKESWTHWEHARRVRFRKEAFTELTRLFEKAKYAPEKVTWEDAERALSLYREIRRGMDENT